MRQEITISEIQKWRNTRDEESLINALLDEDESVRIAAAEVLGVLKSQKAVQPLIIALDDDRLYVRLEASKALGKIGLPAVEPLVKGLGKISFNNEIIPPEKAFWEKRFYVHDAAARTLVRVGKVAVTSLIEVVMGGEDTLCQHASDALARIRDKRAVMPLIDALDRYTNIITKWKLIRSLGEIEDSKSVEPLAEYLKSDIPFLRWETADSLGKIGSRKALPHLFDAMLDEHEEVRRTAARALGRIGDKSAVEILCQVFENENTDKKREDVRWEATKALGRIGGLEAKNQLHKLLKDSRPDICNEAQKALEAIRERE